MPAHFQAHRQSQFLIAVQKRDGAHLTKVEPQRVVGAVRIFALAGNGRGFIKRRHVLGLGVMAGEIPAGVGEVVRVMFLTPLRLQSGRIRSAPE